MAATVLLDIKNLAAISEKVRVPNKDFISKTLVVVNLDAPFSSPFKDLPRPFKYPHTSPWIYLTESSTANRSATAACNLVLLVRDLKSV